MDLSPFLTIGLVGGIGSGKSRVAEMLRELGAEVLDADQIGHHALAEDPAVQESLRRRWGPEVFASDGNVDRKAVAKRVFRPDEAGDADRKFLESLLHPQIRAGLESGRDALAAKGVTVAVLDAALLFEAGWNDVCDLVVFVDAPRATRLERARKHRGWTEEQFSAREAAQWPVEEKRRRADVVIANDGSETELHHAVGEFWQKYVAA